MKIIRYFIEDSLKFVDFWRKGFWGFGNGTIEDLRTFLQTQTTHYKAESATIEDLEMAKVNFIINISLNPGAGNLIIDTSLIDLMPLGIFIDRFFGIEFDSINLDRLKLSSVMCNLSEVDGDQLPTKEELQSIRTKAGITSYTFDPNTNVCSMPINLNESLNNLAEIREENGIISLVPPNSTKLWQELKRIFLTTPQS